MSRVPMMSDGGAWATDPQVAYKTYFVPQGISADLIATKYGISRQDLDAYSVESQQRAAHAWKQGWFDGSIVPIKDHIGRVALAHDELMRPEATVESLGGLKPAFVIPGEQGGFDGVILQKYPEVESVNHVHTAGNSSGIVDGAAAVLVGELEVAADGRQRIAPLSLRRPVREAPRQVAGARGGAAETDHRNGECHVDEAA